MGKRHFTQEQKLAILESAKEVKIRKAAELAGVHYTTLYGWQRELEAIGNKAFLAYEPKSRGRGIKKINMGQVLHK